MITSLAPHVLDTIMIMWTWRRRRDLEGTEKGGKEVNCSHSATTHNRDISLLPVLKQLPTPSFLPLYSLFGMSSGRYSCQTPIWKRKSIQDEAVNVSASWLVTDVILHQASLAHRLTNLSGHLSLPHRENILNFVICHDTSLIYCYIQFHIMLWHLLALPHLSLCFHLPLHALYFIVIELWSYGLLLFCH